MKQIVETGYANRYRDVALLGLAIDDERRGITEFRTEMRSGVFSNAVWSCRVSFHINLDMIFIL
jgi:hypothetical protein